MTKFRKVNFKAYYEEEKQQKYLLPSFYGCLRIVKKYDIAMFRSELRIFTHFNTLQCLPEKV